TTALRALAGAGHLDVDAVLAHACGEGLHRLLRVDRGGRRRVRRGAGRWIDERGHVVRRRGRRTGAGREENEEDDGEDGRGGGRAGRPRAETRSTRRWLVTGHCRLHSASPAVPSDVVP